MTEEKTPGSLMAGLRKKAEEQALSDPLTFGEQPTSAEAKRLLHELQVHQIELEMQNTELCQSQLDLEAIRDRYYDLYDLAPVGFLTLNEEQIILDANITAATLLGVAKTGLVKKPLPHYILSEDSESFYHFLRRFTVEGKSRMCELRMVRDDGALLWVQLRVSSVQPGEYRITLSDISEHRRIEDDLDKEKRVLKALGNSRGALIRANDEASYLDEVCRIIIEDCGFKMVWIGYAEDDKARTVRPVAQAGLGQDYLESVRITWDDKDTGRGPTGTAIRTGRTASCRNMLTDPAFAPWRDQAVQRGYASSLVLPLMGSSKPFGALTIYSPKPEGFSPSETSLLSELAEDLAYGITNLRESKARQEGEAALRRNEAQLQTILNNITEGLIVADLNGDLVYWNPAAVVMYGLADANEGLRHLQDLGGTFELRTTSEEILPVDEWPLARILRGENLNGYELRVRRLDRDWQRAFSYSGALARDTQGRPMLGILVVSDITERKLLEEENTLLETHYRLIAENATDVILVLDAESQLTTYASPSVERVLGFTDKEYTNRHVSLNISPSSLEFVQKVTPIRIEQMLQGDKQFYIDEIEMIHKDGHLVLTEINMHFVKNQFTGLIEGVGIMRDITARKEAEMLLRRSLEEKDMLLKEVHHRVKNNMQVIYSLLDLQAKDVNDRETRALLEESCKRISVMAMIHERLYRSADLAIIDFKDFLQSLIGEITDSGDHHNIAYILNMAPMPLNIDIAIPCGLIINELVTNSRKHAFQDGRKGTVTIEMNTNSFGDIVITVEDNGIGFPPEIDFRETSSLGMQIVIGLTGQIDGTIELVREESTRFNIIFPP